MPPVFPTGVSIQDYIASELAAQKAALEQAIERAKTVIHNSAIEEAAALITAAENTIKNKLTLASQEINDKIEASVQQHVNTIVKGTIIKIFQNGYIQWPGMPAPDTLFTFEGYRWSEVNYDGCFFRAKGKGANPFNGEEQGDAIRNIKGKMGAAIRFREDGAFICENIDYMLGQGNYFGLGNYSFSADKVVPTAEENRSRNRTFIIWKLEKI